MTTENLVALPTPTAADLVALEGYHPSVRVRGLVERAIARKCIEALLVQGFTITVDDGEDEPVKYSAQCDAIMEACFAVEDAKLYVHNTPGRSVFGWVRFVMGNGPDMIADHTVNLEEVLKPVSDYADQMSEWF